VTSPPPAWQRYPYHRPTSALTYPEDEGWHATLPLGVGDRLLADPTLFRMEWVYLNSHLTETSGERRRFVVFVAYFTQELRFLVIRAWDAEDRYLGAWTASAVGLVTAAVGRHDVRFEHLSGVDTWRTVDAPGGAHLDPFHTVLDAHDASLAVHLDLVNTKTPYEAGGVGYLPFGWKGWFGYYSLTRLRATGQLTLPRKDGGVEVIEVAGDGWFDHQWGPFFVTPFRLRGFDSYEWMSVQLDSGDDLLLTTVWDPKGETPSIEAFGGAGIIRADGTFDRIIGSAGWERTRFWRSLEQGAVYSAAWRFRAPEWDLDLTILPRYPDQLTPIVQDPARGAVSRAFASVFGGAVNRAGDFWEGSCSVTGTLRGEPVTGHAFAELVKRYPDPTVHVSVPRDEPGLTVVAWRVDGWDPRVTLTSHFFLEDPATGRVLLNVPDLDIWTVVLDDPTLPRGIPLVARVVASSVDGVLRGEDTTTLRLK
jgi:predicted secreted hydrolase